MRSVLIALALALVALPACADPPAQLGATCDSFTPWGRPAMVDARPLTLLCRHAYIAAHDDDRLVPAWVAWRLTPEHAKGCLPRHDRFAADPDLPAAHRAAPQDYSKTGYDRGHLAPDADMAWSPDVMRESFLMSNMSPQRPGLNRQEWEQLEASTRAWTLDHGDLIVLDGPIYDANPARIGSHGVAVPAAFWKIVVPAEGGPAMAFMMSNDTHRKGPLQPYAVSIAAVERAAGIRIPLPDGVDREAVPVAWTADLSAFATAKRTACAATRVASDP